MKPETGKRCFLNPAVGAAAFFAVMFTVLSVKAAPHNGEELKLGQPDGSEVNVLIYGDELHSVAESPDGYTLVRDANGWICYAELSADGSELVSTGVRYTGSNRAPGARRNLRIDESAAREKRMKNRRNIGDGEEEQGRGFRGKFGVRSGNRNHFEPAPAPGDEFMHAPGELDVEVIMPAPGDTTHVVGFVLFIAFPDFPAPNDGGRFLRYADSAYNHRGFRGNGSVRDYFDDISGGNMQYTNYISAWVTAPNNFSYYDGADNYGRVQELITAALNELNRQPDVAAEIGRRVTTSRRSNVNSNNPTALAMNIHPIRSGQRWSHGIWSHRGWYRGNVSVGGIRFYDYQFTGLGNSGTITTSSTVSLGVIAHENGHMLFDWPDLYPYVSGQRNFVSQYCIMSSTANPPQMPNPFFRSLVGWIDVTDITNMNGLLTHTANSHTAYRFVRDQYESYFIEARRRTGRSSGLPGEGLIIWHVHTRGDNANYEVGHSNAARRIPRVAVMQANNGTGNPNANATYIASRNAQFNRNSTPAARYHNHGAAASATNIWAGELSNINITEISAINTSANNMTFRIGTGSGTTPATYTITFNANYTGGTITPATATTGTNGRLTSLPTPTRSGFAFNGWFTAATGGTEVTTSTVFTTNTTIFARWTAVPLARYAISFNANGGTGTMSVDSVTQGSSYTIKANTFTRAGFTFSGWRTGATSGTRYAAGAEIPNVTANITLFAQWTALPRYAISFNANGGTGTMAVDSVTQGNDYTIKANTFTREGFTFSGWRTGATSGTRYAAGAELTNVTANVTLFAQWTALPRFAISFNANGGTGTMSVDSVMQGNDYTIKANTFTRAGFTFSGWRTGATSGTRYAAGAEIANITANITLFAQWTALPRYAIIFNANGGTGTMAVDSVTQGNDYTIKPNTFTRTNYTFEGWNTAADGTGTDYAADTQITNVTANITLFAIWEEIPTTSVLSPNNTIPVQPDDDMALITPVIITANKFSIGPNPAPRSAGNVIFYRQGARIKDAALTIYDAQGNVVKKIKFSDKAPDNHWSGREVGSWDLTDAKGRTVSLGTYLARGAITTSDGKTERFSVMLGVR